MSSELKVLIIEDDEWLAEHYARVLGKEGVRVTWAPHALAAMDTIDTIMPDVIVLDVFLPGSNAFTLLHELQSHTDLAGIPVVLCSNSADRLVLDNLKPYGVRAMLDKSAMDPDDLLVAIRRVV